MEKSHINIIPMSNQPLSPMTDNHLLEKISEIIKRLYEIKRTNKVNQRIYF